MVAVVMATARCIQGSRRSRGFNLIGAGASGWFWSQVGSPIKEGPPSGTCSEGRSVCENFLLWVYGGGAVV